MPSSETLQLVNISYWYHTGLKVRYTLWGGVTDGRRVVYNCYLFIMDACVLE